MNSRNSAPRVGVVSLPRLVACRYGRRPSWRSFRHVWPFWRLVQKLKAEDRAPRLIVFVENVCGTLTSYAGSDFIAIADALSAESYRFGAIIVDAIGFVPQSRPRLFIIAAADGVTVPPNLVTADATMLWHPRAIQIAQLRLKGKSKDNWVWWKLPAPPRRKTRFADVIEENPKSVSWHTTAETAKLLSMMNDVNLDKVRASSKDRTADGRRDLQTNPP